MTVIWRWGHGHAVPQQPLLLAVRPRFFPPAGDCAPAATCPCLSSSPLGRSSAPAPDEANATRRPSLAPADISSLINQK
jgi:hypothetical protein